MNQDLFEVVGGTEAGTRFSIAAGEAVIGRDPASDIVVSDPRVSRRHARVWFEGPTLMIQDLGSTGGTAVNEDFITRATPLVNGDKVRVGLTELAVVWSPATAATVIGLVVPPPQEPGAAAPPPPAPPAPPPAAAPPPPAAAPPPPTPVPPPPGPVPPQPEAAPPPPPQPAEPPPPAAPEPEPVAAAPPPPMEAAAPPADAPAAAPPDVETPPVSPPAGPVEIQPPPADFDALAEEELDPADDAYATFQRPAIVVPEEPAPAEAPEPPAAAEPPAPSPAVEIAPPPMPSEDEYEDYLDPHAAPQPPAAPEPEPEPVASAPPAPDLTTVRPVITPEDLQAVRADQALPPAPPPEAPPAPAPQAAPAQGAEAAPAPGTETPEQARERMERARVAKEVADAALASQYHRMPTWLSRFSSIFRR